ncbi:hypothetical protein V3C99_002154 [Haemonchus contortus]|uniref:G protein-coupled receptor n=1 Tax=Haemonchus contortus TaxID=6289 RepID=A0A7I5E8X8_HAECO
MLITRKIEPAPLQPSRKLMLFCYIVQYVNNVLAAVSSMFVNVYVIYRMLQKNATFDHYQYLIVTQEVVICTGTILRFLRNRIVLLDGRTSYFQYFVPFCEIALAYLDSSITCVETVEEFFVGVFNIHRTLLIVWPRIIRPFHIVAIPIILVCSVFFAYLSYTAAYDSDVQVIVCCSDDYAYCGITLCLKCCDHLFFRITTLLFQTLL